MHEKGKILAIDYGTKKVGLAVSDDARLLAFGRGIFDRSKGFKTLVKKLEELCSAEKIVEFVFGLALDDEGEEGEQAQKVRNFAKKIGLSFPDIKISFIDESFSSYDAQNMLKESGQHGHDDEMAAVIILQRYIDNVVHGDKSSL